MVLFDIDDIIVSLGGIGYLLLIIFVTIILITFALKIGINAVKGENTGLGSVFITGLIAIFISLVISFVFQFFLPAWVGYLVSLIIDLFIIKARHKTTFLGAFGAIVIYVVVLIVIIIVLSFIFTEFQSALLALIS
ncbi:MAG: hypothetical protein ACTSWX_08925 [Promethearchaeota archaeon]